MFKQANIVILIDKIIIQIKEYKIYDLVINNDTLLESEVIEFYFFQANKRNYQNK